MTKHNAENERIKRKYFIFLKEAKRQNVSTVDAVAKAVSRFETYTKHRDFKAFHCQTFDPCPEVQVFALYFLGVAFADFVLVRVQVALISAPVVRVPKGNK